MTVATPPLPHIATDSSATDSARRAGGPQDHALYQCSCGAHFKAEVSTSVDCPKCGSDQAW
jgi:Zn finger protein HypA/HybF involved in hydrogenase expression